MALERERFMHLLPPIVYGCQDVVWYWNTKDPLDVKSSVVERVELNFPRVGIIYHLASGTHLEAHRVFGSYHEAAESPLRLRTIKETTEVLKQELERYETKNKNETPNSSRLRYDACTGFGDSHPMD
jgi:hypothetical protein